MVAVSLKKKINKKIEKRVYEKTKEEETRKASNEGGWHSDGSMHDDPVMEPIIKFIEWGVKELSVESKMEYKDYSLFLFFFQAEDGIRDRFT